MKLVRYRDFLERVDELGFMVGSTLSHVLPSLSDEIDSANMHTGDPETDPWCWKDRAAEEKRLAYGCIINGHKGFVSAHMYPVFYAAYHPVEFMEELWASGLVNQTTWRLWQVFEEKTLLNTSDIRREMGVTAKKGGSRVDTSIRELQRSYYITVAGNRRKLDKAGKPYGWPACVYDRVTDWAPEDWTSGVPVIDPKEAREAVLDVGMAMGKCSSREEMVKALGLG